MQTIEVNPMVSEVQPSPPKLILFKSVAVASVLLFLSGAIIYFVNRSSPVSKAPTPEQPKRGDNRRELQTPSPPSEPPTVITKKPQQPITIEEGSEAYHCLKNNGGSSCLTRDRFVPNYKVITPPRQAKTYEDYLVEYGIRSGGNCGRYLNGKPHCTGL